MNPLTLTFAFLGSIGLVAGALVKCNLKPQLIIREGKPSARHR